MKYIKEDLEKLIFNENLSYAEIGRRYGVSGTYIVKISNKLGIQLSKRKVHPPEWQPHNKGKGAPLVKCLNCNKECDVYAKKFCSAKCQQELRSKNIYQSLLNNPEPFCRVSYCGRVFKPFILKEQNNKCAICNMENTWNDKPITFILDHIDGNAANNKRENLRLICHNCDSQLDTYKSRNKNSARKERYLKTYKTR